MRSFNNNKICLHQGNTTCNSVMANAQSFLVGTQKSGCSQVQTEYPRPLYLPRSSQCSCPPTPPCPPPIKPCPPMPPCPPPIKPCPPMPPCPPPVPPYLIKGNAHVGTVSPTLLVGGPTGAIVLNKVYTKMGTTVCQDSPLKIRGPHTYLVEWSGGVDPLNNPGSTELHLLVDGVPVPGSANSVQTNLGEEGQLALSGGAIVTVPAGCHTLEIGYKTGNLGAEVANINVRIVELY